MPTIEQIERLLNKAKSLAKEYRELTGKPLGITGELSEFYAAKYLGLELAPAREAGYDAVLRKGNKVTRIQVKGRCIRLKSNPGQRLGAIKLEKEWDKVVLVLVNEDYEATGMYEAGREAITLALKAPGSKARNERGTLGVGKFKSIGRRVWPGCPSDGKVRGS